MASAAGKGTILVAGGTGKTGRRVAARLAGRGLAVRIGARAAVPRFDWNDQGSWMAALEGADAAYIAFHPDLAMPGAAATIGAFVEAAARHGARRLVLLSGRGEALAHASEEALKAAGTEWTILRCAWFGQNFAEGSLRDAVLGGTVALPVGAVPEPFVDAEDIADVAVAALTGAGHAGQTYELTGPRLLTFAEATAEVAKATGRDIRYMTIAPDQFAAGLAAQGAPAEYVALLTELFGQLLDGRNAHLSDDIRRVLGRIPRDFADYVREAVAAGAWGGQ